MELSVGEYEVIISIYYPIIQFQIGMAIIVIQNYETRRRKQFFSEVQDLFYDDADENKKYQALKQGQDFKIREQGKNFDFFLNQQTWKGFGWGLVATSIFLLLIIMKTDHWTPGNGQGSYQERNYKCVDKKGYKYHCKGE